MNMMCIATGWDSGKRVSPIQICASSLPTHAANMPAERPQNARAGKFEDMNSQEAAALLRALDEAFA